MSCKNILSKPLVCGIAMSFLALAPVVANAQSDTMSTTSTTTTTTTTTMATPTMVTGTVLRYYSDRSGYVTAMDVQTADGVQFVRFSPGMGQRLYTTYPVGGTATVYVAPSSGMMAPTVIGVGDTMPSPGMMTMAGVPSDVDVLDSEPYILSGAKLVKMRGTLRDIITSDTGEVVGLVLKNADTPADSMDMTIVRVPREFRQIAPGYQGTERVTPLFKGADVEVTGYPEAPRYGVLSTFGNRIAARALVVNARAVGAVGIQRMVAGKNTLFRNVNIGGAGRSAEEMRAAGMGYSTYSTNGGMMGGDQGMTASTSDTMTNSTTSDTTIR